MTPVPLATLRRRWFSGSMVTPAATSQSPLGARQASRPSRIGRSASPRLASDSGHSSVHVEPRIAVAASDVSARRDLGALAQRRSTLRALVTSSGGPAGSGVSPHTASLEPASLELASLEPARKEPGGQTATGQRRKTSTTPDRDERETDEAADDPKDQRRRPEPAKRLSPQVNQDRAADPEEDESKDESDDPADLQRSGSFQEIRPVLSVLFSFETDR